MVRFIAQEEPKNGWRSLATKIQFTRFEIISYHQWCVMHEGFVFRDVTNLTGMAKWGSYMEDPLPGARIGELEPIWVSSHALTRSEKGVISTFSEDVPPLLLFHADQGPPRTDREKDRKRWDQVMLEILAQHGRTDYHKGNIRGK